MPRCPYGKPGDTLWVRETWYDDNSKRWGRGGPVPRPTRPDDDIYYRANGEAHLQFEQLDAGGFCWRPSIHMPRWASRLSLRVTSVRIERLQDITEDDARAEGCVVRTYRDGRGHEPATLDFLRLWDAINGKRASWASNPWVWVIGFKRADEPKEPDHG
jgi:hypothetical protein